MACATKNATKNDHAFKNGRAMASDFDFRGGKSRIVTILIYVKSTKALLVKRHIACPNRTDLCENYGL